MRNPFDLPAAPAPLAPQSTLLSAAGAPVVLEELWARQPLLVLFLRHYGCAICRAHLHAVRDSYAAIRARGAEVIVIAPSVPATLAPFAARNRLPFLLLADPSRAAYQAWGFEEGSLREAAGPTVALRQAAEALRGRMPYVLPGAPIRQLGGVGIVDRGGRVCFYHQARPIYNYPPLEQYLEVLDSLR